MTTFSEDGCCGGVCCEQSFEFLFVEFFTFWDHFPICKIHILFHCVECIFPDVKAF